MIHARRASLLALIAVVGVGQTLLAQAVKNLTASRCAGAAQHMPSDGGSGRRRWADGEATAEGWQRIPQVQGQA